MSDAVEKATAEAVEAAQQGEKYAELLAVAAALKAAQQPCQHQAPAPAASPNIGKWIAIGAAGSVLAMALAVSAVAVGIGAVALTVCLLVLRSMWREYQGDKDR